MNWEFLIGAATALVTILGAVGAGFAWVVNTLRQMRTDRAGEIEEAVRKIINTAPEKIVVGPQPLEVKGHTRLATWEELQAVQKRVDRLETKLEADTKRILDAGEARASALHEKINAIPAQVIATLRDTKGLL